MLDANTSLPFPCNPIITSANDTTSGYASDISASGISPFLAHLFTYPRLARSYPASGTFTPPQAALYAAVLSAQKALISLCTESSHISLHNLHRKSCELLRVELNQIGFQLDSGDIGQLEKVLYPHFLSHPIGIGQLTVSLNHVGCF